MITDRFQKNTVIKSATAVILAVAVSIALLPQSVARADKISELEEKIKAAKELKAQTQSEINENKQELADLNSTATSLKGALSQLNAELNQVCDNLEDIENRIVAKNQEIDDMEKDLEEALQIEADQYKAMKIRIKYMYEKQDHAVLESLFGASIVCLPSI